MPPSDASVLDDLARMRSRGFGQSVGFGQHPAVLVVDFINAFTDPASPLGAPVEEQLLAANRLIDAAHASRAPVLFTTIAYEDPQLADAGVWLRKIAGLRALRDDSQGIALDDRLHRSSDDWVLRKKYASCFFGTDLWPRLRDGGIDTLIVAGCSTSGCVRATVVDACQLGLRTIVALDAVADRSATAHQQSLLDIEMKYGDIETVDTIRDYLAHRPLA